MSLDMERTNKTHFLNKKMKIIVLPFNVHFEPNQSLEVKNCIFYWIIGARHRKRLKNHVFG